jgi:HK97 family phage portal protein
MDMFHVRGFGDGPLGLNVMEYAAQSIGWARAVQIFGATFFGSGTNLSGVVTMKKSLTQAGLDVLRENFEGLYKGAGKGNKTAFLDAEMDFKPIGVDPNKAQFIETNQFQIEECCRWFGVPPHKVMHLLRATFSNIEHQSIEVVTDSITPWVKRFEEEADYKLFGENNRQGFYTKMALQALLRGDSITRASYYKTMREIGVFTVNEILALEDMNTISEDDGGDKRVMQSQFTTLEQIGEQPITPPSFPSEASPSSGGDQADQPMDGDTPNTGEGIDNASLVQLNALALKVEA